MNKIIINYYNEFVLQESFETVHLHTCIYEYDSPITDEIIEQIELDAIYTRGDNINTEISFYDQQQIVIIHIGFLEREYYEYTDLSSIPVLKNLDYVKAIEEKLNNYLNKLESYEQYPDTRTLRVNGFGELFAISLHEDDQTIDHLIQDMKKYATDFTILKRSKWNWNAGASSFGEEVILWVANLIVGGVAWDILKARSNGLLEVDKSKNVTGINLDRIITEISEITGENAQSFSLRNLEILESGRYKLIYQNYFQEIIVISDSSSCINELNINELSKTRI